MTLSLMVSVLDCWAVKAGRPVAAKIIRVFAWSILLAVQAIWADGLTVGAPKLEALKDGSQTVRFDLQWNNSWRNDLPGEGQCGPRNYDAAWVFVKYRVGDGPWMHATLSTTAGAHNVPAGAALEVGLTDDRGVGVFLHRDRNGMGRFSAKSVGLCWERVRDQVARDAAVTIKVLALEMVHVSAGPFWVGDGQTDAQQFHEGGSQQPFRITSEDAIAIGSAKGQLDYAPGKGAWDSDRKGPLPAAYPKGFAAFYGMKYELNQAQFVEYLNTLTPAQDDWSTRWDGIVKQGLWPTRWNGIRKVNGAYETHYPDKAAGYLLWRDQAAYLDWAGLRPMTELEYEKACRGPLVPVPGEFAWGDAEFVLVQGLVNEGTPDERPVNQDKANLADQGIQLLRGGCLGIGSGSRHLMGAGYYGMLELAGSQCEPVASAGSEKGRAFTGVHGDGRLTEDGYADVTNWPGRDVRGAGWCGYGMYAGWFTVSRRGGAAAGGMGDSDGHIMYGVRGVRTAVQKTGEPIVAEPQHSARAPDAKTDAAGVGAKLEPGTVLVLPKGKEVRAGGLTTKGGAAALQTTTVTVSWDDEALLVVFDCADTNRIAKWADTRDSDKTWKDDSVAILLDLGHRHAEGGNLVMFKLSAAGGLQDCHGKNRDIEFTVPGVTSKVEFPPVSIDAWRILPPTEEQKKAAQSTVPANHWRGTIRIPWKGLGVKPSESEVWGVNFTRIDQPGMTFMAWAPFENQFEELQAFGHLVFAPADGTADVPALAAWRHSINEAHARLAGEYMNENDVLALTPGRSADIQTFRVIQSGVTAREATTATLTWGDAGLDVVMDCKDKGLVAEQQGRDNIKLWKDDSVYLFLDPGHTHDVTNSWMIQISASGAFLDHRNNDPKVDMPGLQVETARTDAGWRAHFRIPWTALEMKAPKDGQVWGLNLARMNQRCPPDNQHRETSAWTSLPEGDLSLVDCWGHLVFSNLSGVNSNDAARIEGARPSIVSAHATRWRQIGPRRE